MGRIAMNDAWKSDEIAVHRDREGDGVTIRVENEPSTYFLRLTWPEANVMADKLMKAIDERPEWSKELEDRLDG